MTNDLVGRVYTHRENLLRGQTSRYRIHTLVWFEVFEDIEEAILREKRMKTWRRDWKIELIEKSNPEWLDLYPEVAAMW